jgi:hypothetical protein
MRNRIWVELPFFGAGLFSGCNYSAASPPRGAAPMRQVRVPGLYSGDFYSSLDCIT